MDNRIYLFAKRVYKSPLFNYNPALVYYYMKHLIIIAVLLIACSAYSQVDNTYIEIAFSVNGERYAQEYNEIQQLMKNGDAYLNNLEKRMRGKSRDKIADILYDEDFAREVIVNSLVIERYTNSFGEVGKYFKVWVDMWKSYGGSKLETETAIDYRYEGWKYDADTKVWKVRIGDMLVDYPR